MVINIMASSMRTVFVGMALLCLAGTLWAQTPQPRANPTNGGGRRPAPLPGRGTPGYQGPQGGGNTGGQAPAGVGQSGGSSNTAPQGGGQPTPPGGGGGEPPPTGGTGAGAGGGTSPAPAPGTGSPPNGGAAPGSPGASGPGRRRGGNTGILEVGVADDSWQNWWRLNEDWFLQLEGRFHDLNQEKETSRDLYVGEDPTLTALPIGPNDLKVKKVTLPLLRAMLRHKYFGVRAQAAIAIGKAGAPEQVSWLAPLTKDKNKEVRKAAIIGLGLLQTEKSLPFLQHLLRDRGTAIAERAYAAIGLGLCGKSEVASFMIDRLSKGRRVREIDAAILYALGMIKSNRAQRYLDYFVANPLKDDILRAVALQGLAMQGSPKVVDTLLKSLKDKDVRVRRSAAISLGQIQFRSRYRDDWEKLSEEVSSDGGYDGLEVSERAAGELESLRARLRVQLDADENRLAELIDQVVEALESQGLDDSDVMVRNFSALALGELATKRAQEILKGQLYNAKLDSTRAFSALALSLKGGQNAGAELLRRLSRRRMNQETRAAVLLAVGLAGGDSLKEAKGIVKKNFRSRGDTAVARYSAVSLGLLGDEKVVKILRERLLSKSRPELKEAYGQALALLGDYEVVRSIAKVLNGRGSVIHKVELASALSAIRDRHSLDALANAAKPEKRKNTTLAAIIRAIGVVAERGDRPILSPWFRHLNYQLELTTLNEIALL